MSTPSLGELILDVDQAFPAESSELRLTSYQVTQLKRIRQASGETANVLTSGIEAIGEMMGLAEGGEMSTESVVSIGWLIKELAGLTRRLQEERNAASHKLEKMSRAPQNDTPANRAAAHGGDQ